MVLQGTWLPRWRTPSYHLHKDVILHSTYTVILLFLRPAPLTHKNPQRLTKVHCMSPVGRKDRLILRCFCKTSCLCDFCGCSCGGCLKTHISFGSLLRFTKEYLLSVWSHKGQGIFKLGLIFSFNCDSVVLEWDSKFLHKMQCFR